MRHYEIKNFIYAILKYEMGDCDIEYLKKQIEIAKKYYRINKINPKKNDLALLEIALQTISNGVQDTINLLSYKLK